MHHPARHRHASARDDVEPKGQLALSERERAFDAAEPRLLLSAENHNI